MAEFDTIIKGGTIVDGTLVPPYRGDIGIKNGRITTVSYTHLTLPTNREV